MGTQNRFVLPNPDDPLQAHGNKYDRGGGEMIRPLGLPCVELIPPRQDHKGPLTIHSNSWQKNRIVSAASETEFSSGD
ncbi:hypothetical protein HR09_09070 [Porphyromonas gulae]|nr:hypothetical protein HR09_09070 [Porphyromonas gulae]